MLGDSLFNCVPYCYPREIINVAGVVLINPTPRLGWYVFFGHLEARSQAIQQTNAP